MSKKLEFYHVYSTDLGRATLQLPAVELALSLEDAAKRFADRNDADRKLAEADRSVLVYVSVRDAYPRKYEQVRVHASMAPCYLARKVQ